MIMYCKLLFRIIQYISVLFLVIIYHKGAYIIMKNDIDSFIKSCAYKKIDLITNAEFINKVSNLPIAKRQIYKYLKAQGKINCSYPYFSFLLKQKTAEKETTPKEEVKSEEHQTESKSKVVTTSKVEAQTNLGSVKAAKKEIISKTQEKVPFHYDPTEDIQIF